MTKGADILFDVGLVIRSNTYENLCEKGEPNRRVFTDEGRISLIYTSDGFKGEVSFDPQGNTATDFCNAVNRP